jgi:hypothetical protein
VRVPQPALLPRVADQELPSEDQAHQHERSPEVNSAQRLVQHSSEHLREPEVDRCKGGEQGCRRQGEVKVTDHE